MGKVICPVWKYLQYEFAVPFSKVHACYDKLFNHVLKSDQSRKLLSGEPALMRFVGQADNDLSATHDGPRLYINMDVDVAFRPHTAAECTLWDEVLQLFLSDTCSARFHWGKAGWDQIDAAQADAMYPNLTNFRTKMKAWDPSGKFRGSSPVFEPGSPHPSKGKCVGTSSRNKRVCASAERQASECMCRLAVPWGQGDCDWLYVS